MSDIIEVIKDVTTVTIASDGPQGPAGPTGPTGPEGAAGPTGPSGVISVVAPITNTGTSTSAIIGINAGVANGVATLDSSGLVPTNQLPALAITNTFVVASQAAMLALTAETGDVAIRTDLNESYILTASPASTLANWQELLTPPDAVASVDGRVGNVTLSDLYAGLASANTFTGGVQTITTASAATVGFIIRGSSSQSANLLEFKDSASTNVLTISPFGAIRSASRLSIGNIGIDFGVFSLQIGSAGTIGAVVRGAASQTANLQEWQNSAGTVLTSVNSAGQVSANSFLANTGSTNAFGGNLISGVILAARTSNAAVIPLAVRGAASQTANLQEWQSSTGSLFSYVNSAGQIGAQQILSRYYVNTTNVGAYIDLEAVSNSATILQRVAGSVGLIVRGAPSQTADLQQWQNSAGTVMVAVTSAGAVKVGTSISGVFAINNIINGASVVLVVQGASGQSANLQNWQDSAGSVQAFVDNVGIVNSNNATGFRIASATFYGSLNGGQTARVQAGGSVGANPHLVVRQVSAATGNLQEWQNSSSTILTAVNASGTINFASGNTSATANTGAVALPALAVGFITMQVAGTTVKVPYYAN